MLCFIPWQKITELLYLVLSFLLQRTFNSFFIGLKKLLLKARHPAEKELKMLKQCIL